MEIQNQREEQLEDLRRKREAFVQVSLIRHLFKLTDLLLQKYRKRIMKF
jgi:hypothetical protein